MIDQLITIIGLACLTNIVVTAAPIKSLRELLGFTITSRNTFKSMVGQLLSCALCTGTWIGMLSLMNIEQGAIVAVLAELINRKLTTFEV